MVRFGFGFISLKPKKSNQIESKPKKPSQTGKKTSQTGFYPKKPNRTEISRFDFLKKNSVYLLFFNKNQTE
jgi:hypothetical protein